MSTGGWELPDGSPCSTYLELLHRAERRGALHAFERLRNLVHVFDVRVQMSLLAERRRADLK